MIPDEVPSIQILPVELLYDIQLLALSEHLPFVSKRLHQVYQASSPLYRAKYICFRLSDIDGKPELYTKALRYPCCDLEVLEAFNSLVKPNKSAEPPALEGETEARDPGDENPPLQKVKPPLEYFDLPRRLFKYMVNHPTAWTEKDAPLPYLEYLFDTFQDHLLPNPNANSGYALTKAVHVQSIPLVRYLLAHGASPKTKDCLAIMVAIRQKNLALVKTLIERQDQATKSPSKKRRRLEDRVKPDSKMLKTAVQCKAKDITEYLCHEKGVVPDMQTLQMML